ncbi:MAG: hypothetical protein COA78_30220 [Blastopirellula sp.]|nr:MAG: hypothetical protein COA78_30220 [Blastopirellula sp.]
MPLIIDGYNLLYAAGIVSSLDGRGSFAQDRQLLLDSICDIVPAPEIEKTVVVFDASYAPPGLPRTVQHQGITVHFASDYADADTMIEELILQHSSPRKLTVVSSDHRIQRAARRRKATAVDSDRWFAEQQRTHHQTPKPQTQKPKAPLSGSEVEKWLQEFGDVDLKEVQSQLDAYASDAKQKKQQAKRPVSSEPTTPRSSKQKPAEEEHWEQLASELGLQGTSDEQFEDEQTELANTKFGGIFTQEYLDQIAEEMKNQRGLE